MAGPGSNRAGHRSRCMRFLFGDGLGFGHAKPSGLGTVSWLQHIAGRARDARQRPGAACCAAGPELRRRGPCPGHVEHEKKTFFS